jgi:SAM-dependent methyltransferase
MDRYERLANRIPAFAGLVDDHARDQVRWLLHEASPRLRVLDAGCGGGRHSVLIAAEGHTVVGIDTSPPALSIARQQAEAHGVSVPFVEGDLRDPPPGPFDLILLMDVTLGVFDDDEARAVLATLRSRLAPSGRVILELYHRPFWQQRLGTTLHAPGELHPVLGVERTYREEPGRIVDEIVLFDGEKREDMPVQDLRAWTLEEAVALVARAGLKPLDLWGPDGFNHGPSPSPHHPGSAFMWIVAGR